MAGLLGFVLAFDHVERHASHGTVTVIAGDAVCGVEVEQEKTVAQSTELGDARAADRREARSKSIPVVCQSGRAPGEEALHHGLVDRIGQRPRSAFQGLGRPEPCPGGEHVGSADGGTMAGAPLPVLRR